MKLLGRAVALHRRSRRSAASERRPEISLAVRIAVLDLHAPSFRALLHDRQRRDSFGRHDCHVAYRSRIGRVVRKAATVSGQRTAMIAARHFRACGISYWPNRRVDYVFQSLCGLAGATRTRSGISAQLFLQRISYPTAPR